MTSKTYSYEVPYSPRVQVGALPWVERDGDRYMVFNLLHEQDMLKYQLARVEYELAKLNVRLGENGFYYKVDGYESIL